MDGWPSPPFGRRANRGSAVNAQTGGPPSIRLRHFQLVCGHAPSVPTLTLGLVGGGLGLVGCYSSGFLGSAFGDCARGEQRLAPGLFGRHILRGHQGEADGRTDDDTDRTADAWVQGPAFPDDEAHVGGRLRCPDLGEIVVWDVPGKKPPVPTVSGNRGWVDRFVGSGTSRTNRPSPNSSRWASGW